MGRSPSVFVARHVGLALAGAACVALLPESTVRSQQPRSDRPAAVVRIHGRRAAAGEVLVRFRPSAQAQALTRTLDIDVNESLAGGIRRLRSRRHSTEELLDRLRAQGDVLYAEPNFLVTIAAAPNDPYLPDQWAFRDPIGAPGINATGAWAISTGSRRHAVGIVDTGVDYTHPDLRANVWSAPTAFTVSIGGVSVSCPAGSHGFNALLMTCDPADDHGHGTRMAGVIGAVGNNGIGVSGVNWAASLMALKFMDAGGTGWNSDAVKAIEFAVQARKVFASTGAADVRVLSNSWTSTGYSIALEDEVIRAGANQMLVVASAGNDSRDTDLDPVYPAGFEFEHVISVAATDEYDALEWYSNFGTLTVDIAAPGHGIMSTLNAGGYGLGDGTSPAGAFAAGSAALVLSHCSVDTPTLRRLLVENVDVLGTLSGKTETSGRLNVGRTIRACGAANTAPEIRLSSPFDQQRFTTPASIAITADASDPDGSVARVDFYVGSTLVGTDTTAPFGLTWTTQTTGAYKLKAVATDNLGATTETSTARTVYVDAAGTASLAAPWSTRDVGATGVAGTASGAGGAITAEGGGADVWGTADAFRFVYQSLTGDGRITARVRSLEQVEAWTKAGVMIRSSLQADAAHAFMLVSPGKGTAFQRRKAVGSLSTHTAGAAVVAPYWVRIERRGQSVLGSISSNGTSWTLVAQDTIALGATAYIGLAVSSHRSGVLATATFDAVAITTTSVAGVLPSGWTASDVGAVGAAGSTAQANGTFTARGSGADVWSTADAFHFAYRTLAGDGEIIARVASVENVQAWTKAGVMIRQSLARGSAHAFMMATPGKGLAFQRRTASGGLSVHTSGGAGTAPHWVRLTRQGQTITAYHSLDGTSWILVGRDTLAIAGPVYVGLAISSHEAGRLASAVFTNVTVR